MKLDDEIIKQKIMQNIDETSSILDVLKTPDPDFLEENYSVADVQDFADEMVALFNSPTEADKVETVPLSRWTKLGFKQTFTSVFCAGVLNYMSDLLERPIYTLEQFNNVFSDNEKFVLFQ